MRSNLAGIDEKRQNLDKLIVSRFEVSGQLRTPCNKRGCNEGKNEVDENGFQNPVCHWVWAIGPFN